MSDINLFNNKINEVTQKVINAAKDTLGDKLSKVILFGSYARGDFDNESDMDFFILADVPQEETANWRKDIDRRIPDLWFDYDVLVCLHVTSKAVFERYYPVLPFYQNVIKEGVEMNG